MPGRVRRRQHKPIASQHVSGCQYRNRNPFEKEYDSQAILLRKSMTLLPIPDKSRNTFHSLQSGFTSRLQSRDRNHAYQIKLSWCDFFRIEADFGCWAREESTGNWESTGTGRYWISSMHGSIRRWKFGIFFTHTHTAPVLLDNFLYLPVYNIWTAPVPVFHFRINREGS